MREKHSRTLQVLMFLALLLPPPASIHAQIISPSLGRDHAPWTSVLNCRGRNRLSGPTRQQAVSRTLRLTAESVDRPSAFVATPVRPHGHVRPVAADREPGHDPGQTSIDDRLRC